MEYYRKSHITTAMRASIGASALINSGVYGFVTNLAKEMGVSRPFVYTQKETILSVFKIKPGTSKAAMRRKNKEEIKKLILALRFCCKSSINGISETLKILGYDINSNGFISEYLNELADKLIDDLPIVNEPISILADEIFVCGQPILVILDAISHTILAIELSPDRKGETWMKCYKTLIDKGYEVNVIAKDLGSGLQKGIDLINENEKINIISVADLFHLLVRFNPFIASLEKKAEGTIETEENKFKLFENRKSKKAINKAELSLLEAIDKCDSAILKFDIYEYLRKELHSAFNPFNENGSFRDYDIIHGDVIAILDLLQENFENYEKINSAIKFLRKNINGYIPYLTQIEEVMEKYNSIIPEYLNREICLSYQKALKSIAIKDYSLSKKIYKESNEHFKLAIDCAKKGHEKNNLEDLLEDLQKTVRSSSALEAKNSVLRSYINTMSGQITQKHLNLIAFYMNHKISIRGKYKGKSPLERLTGVEEKENFINLLLAI